MQITLYTTHQCQPCRIAKRAMEGKGIAFTVAVATDHIDALRTLGFHSAPVTVIQSGQDVAAWQGYRPDYIALLADLVADGPVPRCGLGDEYAAREAVLTQAHARQELARHGASEREFFDEYGQHPLYRGAVLLDWLGY